jgi:hypothetical protein
MIIFIQAFSSFQKRRCSFIERSFIFGLRNRSWLFRKKRMINVVSSAARTNNSAKQYFGQNPKISDFKKTI